MGDEVMPPVTHEQARESAQRLINSHFHSRGSDVERARVSIPANPARDDDLLISRYIEEQAAKDTRPTEGPATVSVEGLVESVAEAIYEKLPFSDPGFGVKPKWVIGGNSEKQYEARIYANAALGVIPTNEILPGKFCDQLTDVPNNVVVTCENPAACEEYGCQRKELETRKENWPHPSLLNLFMYANSLSWNKKTRPIANEIHKLLREASALSPPTEGK